MNEEKYGEDNESNNNQNLSGVSGSKSKGKGNEKKDQCQKCLSTNLI